MPLRSAGSALGLRLELVLHVTVLVPFVPEPSPADRDLLRRIARDVPPFEVGLRRFDRFTVEEPNVLWLVPEPREPFLRLVDGVVDAFPGYAPYAGRYTEVVPHATVASGTAPELDAIEDRLRERLPLRDRATEIEFVRVGEQMVTEATWPLGG